MGVRGVPLLRQCGFLATAACLDKCLRGPSSCKVSTWSVFANGTENAISAHSR